MGLQLVWCIKTLPTESGPTKGSRNELTTSVQLASAWLTSEKYIFYCSAYLCLLPQGQILFHGYLLHQALHWK